ncbi:hypothetical protein GJAV_G00172350 [Gymnothorax javanicus]|nr:hypothetical protein GJAV_G00172350 [Gymnothorax javanicus]
MSGLIRSLRVPKSNLRPLTAFKAGISSKPAKHNLYIGEQVFAMTIIFASVLGPSGWILAHLEEYKGHDVTW